MKDKGVWKTWTYEGQGWVKYRYIGRTEIYGGQVFMEDRNYGGQRSMDDG